MAHAASKEIRLADYTPYPFHIEQVDVDVDIRDPLTRVTTRMEYRVRDRAQPVPAMVLNGEDQTLEYVAVNGKTLSPREYSLKNAVLTLKSLPAKGVVEVVSTHNPFANTALSGFYASGTMLSTQCEAEGFRRITFYPDRPDVMARFCVTLHGDKERYPVLLANGNLLATGDEVEGRHFALWEDPFPKPCYLFAMVAGKLDKVTDHFTTQSGRKVLIEMFVEAGRTKDTRFALKALKQSMRWDEQAYGREYDLDRFMLVATPFFNMGAMENKGLNIFNDACVLGRSDTATDATISFIERVVAHEYFHNWTGNRITCRDWFQLSLKEGLTVYREHGYMGDMHSTSVERLGNVRLLRRAQFAEDAGAMAHPVRPDRYKAIDNFYTATVYEKGAEVIRVLRTLVGEAGFRRGMDLYFKRHDGQAVTCDDFVKAILEAQKPKIAVDHPTFMRWYTQAGTPVVTAKHHYDAAAQRLTLTLTQHTPPTAGQKKKLPLPIPVALGLLDAKGKDIIPTETLLLTEAQQDFVIDGLAAMPTLSLLREFSAPVRLVYDQQTTDDLLFLLAHDSDPFNRWEAGFKLLTQHILTLARGEKPAKDHEEKLLSALKSTLKAPKLDAAFKAIVLTLPSESELGLAWKAEGGLIDPDALYMARKRMVKAVATALYEEARQVIEKLRTLKPTATDGVSMGKRSLKNLCLAYCTIVDEKTSLTSLHHTVTTSSNMTDIVAALSILVDIPSAETTAALTAFEKKWQDHPTIMDKWFAVQAGARITGVRTIVKALGKHPRFDGKNPNRISALYGSFAVNGRGFHAKDGKGYAFVADLIKKIDPINPHSGAGLAKAFARWRDYDIGRQAQMQAVLHDLAKVETLSANTREVIDRSLA